MRVRFQCDDGTCIDSEAVRIIGQWPISMSYEITKIRTAYSIQIDAHHAVAFIEHVRIKMGRMPVHCIQGQCQISVFNGVNDPVHRFPLSLVINCSLCHTCQYINETQTRMATCTMRGRWPFLFGITSL